NPPYLRFARWPEHFKALYPTVTPRYALSDLAHAFLDAVIHASHPGSLIAFVTADRWLFNQTAANLREQLGKAIVLKDVRRLPIGSTFE
uniref:hypothetical protein n=1 Tax=Enterobacter hormaechei TaxID=158836 RepID=UPI00195396FA